ncbi:MAG: YdcF family protein [Chloroflexi bacterium]|nr:YdcF family protein [Chloroflexota bacterium]
MIEDVSAPVSPRALSRSRYRWGRWIVRGMIALAVLGLLLVIGLAIVIMRYGVVDRAVPADVIVVLGGGRDGTARRTLHASALYDKGYAPYIVCSGGTGSRYGPSEAARCARWAERQGVPSNRIILEEISLSTEENAIETAAIMRARGWDTAIVVSDDYHLWRANLLFEAEGVTVYTSPAQHTDYTIERGEKAKGLLREIAATGWYVAKSLLGLPYTRVGD